MVLLEQGLLILILIFAVFSIETKELLRSILYLGVLSLLLSFVYILYKAPDVAMAEMVISSTLGTIIYLVAIQKHKQYEVYTNIEDKFIYKIEDHYEGKGVTLLKAFATEEDLNIKFKVIDEVHLQARLEYGNYDLIIIKKENTYLFYGSSDNYMFDKLNIFIENDKLIKDIEIKTVDGGEVVEE